MTPLPSKPAPRFVLVHSNSRHERHYFVALGNPWPGRPERRLIAETTGDKAGARVFETMPEAMEILVVAGDPPDWEVEVV